MIRRRELEEQKPETASGKKKLTTGGCAALLGISPQAVISAIERGDIPLAETIGRYRFVWEEDCLAYQPTKDNSERGKRGMKSRWGKSENEKGGGDDGLK
jgi:hypothetical protein